MSSVFAGVIHSDMKSSGVRVRSEVGREERMRRRRGSTEEGGVACSMMEIKNRWSVVAGMN